jgi:HAD superfamily hydrolase (TIGR01509 family)
MGKRWVDVLAAIVAAAGMRRADEFAASYQARMLARFRCELRSVVGAREHILAFPHTLKCIASSSSPERLAVCLDVLCLQAQFGGHVFSASSVARGKPHPDIFLFAAASMGVNPAHCLVIEDSAAGVEAGRAAGMTVIGLLAASHIPVDHHTRLLRAGAHHVALTFKQAERFTREFLLTLGD